MALAEPSGDGYARVRTDGSDWSASSGGAVANSQAITFPESTDSWGTITHFGLYDASTAGNFLAGGNVFIYINAAIENGAARGNLVPADGTMAYPLFPDTTAGKIYIEHCGPFSAPAGIACATGSKWLDTSADTSKAWNGSAWA